VFSSHFVTDVSVSGEGWTVVDVFSPSRREEIYQQIDNALWFRCNIEWLDHGFLTQVIFLDDVDEQREELEEKLQELKEVLEPLEYELLLDNEMTYFHQGCNILQENAQSALECFEESLSINPFFGRAWDRQGVALQILGRNTEALVSYRMAMELDPVLINTEVNLATIYASQGLFRKAESSLENIVEDDPEYVSAWLRLSRARFEIGDIEEANEALENAL
jgi:tetratricopeptide (TPR) repeat protein